MKKSSMALTFTLTVMLLLCSMQAYAIPTSYGSTSHTDPAWQELATFNNGTLISESGVFWSVDNGATWGQDTTLFVGQQVQFRFNMHKDNVGTHYADYLKAWIDWDKDNTFNNTGDVLAYGYQPLLDNETGNLGSKNPPNIPDYTFLSDTYILKDDDIGDLFLRARVTCSHSLSKSMGYKDWYKQWDISDAEYESNFNPTGYLYQGETEEWKITVNPVPEPTTLFLMGSGLVGMIGLGRKKK